MRKDILGGVVVVLALAFAGACNKASTPTSPSDPVQTLPPAPTPTPGSTWSTFGQIELRGATTVGSYVQVVIAYSAPRPLCRVYVRKIKDPKGVETENRTPPLCDSNSHGAAYTSVGIEMPGRYEVSVMIYESVPDNGAMNPDAPVVRQSEVMGR